MISLIYLSGFWREYGDRDLNLSTVHIQMVIAALVINGITQEQQVSINMNLIAKVLEDM